MIFYVISFLKFRFFSNVSESIIIPNVLKMILYCDIVFTSFFIVNIFGIACRLFMNLYNNRTQLENIRTPIVEYYCPVCPRCVKDFRRFNIEPEINLYNIGFLANLYYLIGPTPFHFIFPLPKYKNFTLDENCPIFKKTKMADRLDVFKYMVKKDHKNINLLDNDESSPIEYIKACHKYYDKKTIV